jgi:hypothetical protein
MPKTSKVQNYAIQFLLSQNKTVAEIALELNLTEKQVSGVIEKSHPSSGDESNIKTSSSKAGKSRSKDLMITETAGKGTKNVAIMTKEASELNDHLRSKPPTKKPRNFDGAIFKPHGE